MMPAPAQDMTAPPPPSGGEGAGKPDPRPMLVQVLQKAKAMADEAGIDFMELVTEVTGGEPEMEDEGEGSVRPPSPAALGSM